MSISLAEALQAVDLKSGQTYRCEVKGKQIEVRVLGPEGPPASVVFTESDFAPSDDWVELPEPIGGTPVICLLGELDPPDIPEIPTGDEIP